ncbi:hypothetical protein [Shigella sp. FC1967]|uniref:hypothetical protein n=1 Tax=Shigella sp. FC1967 TaxID=1898041 RepID=UPI00257073B6|nr:hypothetical protein [Shigella sp. FC1967]
MIAFKRIYEDNSINIYCNFSGEEKALTIKAKDIYLHNSPIVENAQGELILQPYQAIIFA